MAPDSILTEARRVLSLEGDALHRLSETIPADFAPAVQAILDTRGRVVVSGIGKSGHIGNKITATLASTGTPAYFVHPSEASHGDLGMITAQDICLLISNSGETAELGDLIAYTQRFSIPVIGISSREGSTLMRAARYKLTLPPVAEACGIGMAPTTSTTMTLALGDALAVCLMAQRGFAPEDFHVFHPGGKLGAQMMRVTDLMHKGEALPLVAANAPMSDVLLTMTSKGFGMAGVLSDGRLSGVISDGDLRRHMDGLMDRKAHQIATANPVTISQDSLAAQALAVMNQRKIGALFVVDDTGAPVGILHLHDCLRAGVA
ncbi:KpsF/GutQ family sugar-phosphate isomerase [Pseudoprimorskyibacter insulae]|uniref:Arabinose 5-phosphate isomerase KdsD n=1 Tax=Pseudoprimorskyibacter insulae TaxID=1695997 RepID=A0A2R8B0J9_9RHOB|nr:KpsF/GutQ family sugar-phosphate isomerase [Pseudoprimorskyibacter insulae]SPF81802.1 Arabinose 5-phosphate isomerase KdsD [Pseudoprimorskyibacter insulae]